MSLTERIGRAQQGTPREAPSAGAIVPAAVGAQIAARESWLSDVRRRLQIEVIQNSHALFDEADSEDLGTQVEAIVDRFVATNSLAVTHAERVRLVEEVLAEITGFGPIEPLLRDETITEVMVNGPDHIYIERRGKIERVATSFLNDDHVLRIIDRIITPLGRRIDQTSPRVDARLPDGSRVNCVIEPLSLIGPIITVRKFSARPFTVDDLIGFGTASSEMFDFLRACVQVRLNMFVSGGTGSGKTTTLNVISAFIPEEERIITIEDAAELQLRQEHVVTLESRPPNLEGLGEITSRDLLKNALHMRPDRIIVGECRGGEALDMIQAMTVGQEGSLSTGHANSSPDMLRRLETMILMAGYDMPLRTIREQIASAVDVIVHTARLSDGSRKIVTITEVYGIEDDKILTQDIFEFRQTGIEKGKVQGELHSTGVRPTFMPKFGASGIPLPEGEFGIPPDDPSKPAQLRMGKGRTIGIIGEAPKLTYGLGRVVVAGGMAYVSSVGPVMPDTGLLAGDALKVQAHQCMENLQARLAEAGSSLDRVAAANWALKDPADWEMFNEEWVRWFPGDGPVGQLTVMSPQHRRAGFRVSLGVIAETDGSVPSGRLPAPIIVEPPAPVLALPAGMTAERRGRQRRLAKPEELAIKLIPATGERRRGDRRRPRSKPAQE